ncbi:hypothetical protein E3T55_18745 [Cryobacterium frigoriphilum]|uniref:Uncharacterized protein n=1 Tax=Cryobacterium frigoriphilum TaxID=1259150 RepID=A0A4R8ZTK6_9MICO|nr:hypothetical protein [Cryobacterium frigoriphilum]TFD45375.1 hypothetical protein E3T55_18745 [Cryobacterium frigoriphilum]
METDPFALPAFVLAIISLAVATIGALTGVAALAWQIVTRTRGAHRVSVNVANSMVLDEHAPTVVLIGVEAINSGVSAVRITTWGMELPNKSGGFVVANPLHYSTPLPHLLEPGTNAHFFLAAETLGANIRHNAELSPNQLRVFVKLATGQTIYAKKTGVPLADEFWR